MSSFSRLSFLPLLGLLACVPPWEPLLGCADAGACTTGSTGGDGDGAPTTDVSDGIQTVTGNGEDSTSIGTAADTDDSTTGEPAAPRIVSVELSPSPIEFNGPIAVTVWADDAAGVRMELDDGDMIELASGEPPGVFHGEIAVLTGMLNGSHDALLTPWRDGVEGETKPASYQIALPKPGSEGFWETGDLIGAGQVAAMGVLPSGQVVEFGTLTVNGTSQCYLRRRTKGGAWGPGDLQILAPGDPCQAIDLVVDEEGGLYTLVNRQGMDGIRWWLAKTAAWGQDSTNLGIGTKGETVSALALHDSGAVAVCGHAPSPWSDDDAMARIFRPDLPGEAWTFDYQPPDLVAHWFSERTRDCVFAGDTLALAGEAYGRHDNEMVKRDRLSILRFDITSKARNWTVAPAGVKSQSGAQAVDVDDEGRLIVGGYTCDDACQPEADLRIYDGDQGWPLSLGTFPTKQFAVQDLAWSPAGYAVVATGGVQGNETAFTVRAFAPDSAQPLWTFARKDSQVLHLALALAVGLYGEVYAGGFGANGYPAVAYIGG